MSNTELLIIQVIIAIVILFFVMLLFINIRKEINALHEKVSDDYRQFTHTYNSFTAVIKKQLDENAKVYRYAEHLAKALNQLHINQLKNRGDEATNENH